MFHELHRVLHPKPYILHARCSQESEGIGFRTVHVGLDTTARACGLEAMISLRTALSIHVLKGNSIAVVRLLL